MVSRDLVLAVIIGIIIFETDLAFGWLTILCGPIPVIFIMAVIIGIIAGKIGAALLSTLLTWVFSISIGVLLIPIIYVNELAPDQSIFSLFLIVFFYSLRGMYSFTYEGDFFEVLIVGFLYIVVMLIVTPIIYLFSFVFAVAGGVIGRVLRDSLMKKEAPVPQQPDPTTTDPQ